MLNHYFISLLFSILNSDEKLYESGRIRIKLIKYGIKCIKLFIDIFLEF